MGVGVGAGAGGIGRFGSGGAWEERFGYSRAVRAGDFVLVAGTTAIDEDGVVHAVGDAGAQTAFVLERVEAALGLAGASMDQSCDAMFVTDMSARRSSAVPRRALRRASAGFDDGGGRRAHRTRGCSSSRGRCVRRLGASAGRAGPMAEYPQPGVIRQARPATLVPRRDPSAPCRTLLRS